MSPQSQDEVMKRSRNGRVRFFPGRSSRAISRIGFAISSAKPGNNFEALAVPTRKDQLWRFSNVALLDLAPFKFEPPLSDKDRDAILNYSRGLDEVRRPDDFRERSTHRTRRRFRQLKKRGVIFQPLERAMVEHADLFRKYFMSHRRPRLGQVRRAAPGFGFVWDISFSSRAA